MTFHWLLLVLLTSRYSCCNAAVTERESDGTTFPPEITTQQDLNATEDPIIFDDTVSKVAEASNYFALKLYREVALQNRSAAFAPFSVFTVLSALCLGSEKQTAEELNRTLGFGLTNLTEPDMLEGFRELATRLHKGGLRLANGLWLKDGLELQSDFRQAVEQWFMAQVANFKGGAEAQETINSWVNRVTEGRVPQLLMSPPDEAARILLLSALHFKGVWLTRFDPAHTFRGSFRRGVNDTIPASMMSVQGRFRYGDSPQLGAKLLEMPFSGDEVSMLLVLPDSSLTEVEGRLGADVLYHAVDDMRESAVLVTVPKFELKGSLELRESLRSLGVHRAFGSGAQLGRMTVDGGEDLFVSEVMHRAVVEVDEQGAEAAGVSGLSITSKRGQKFETFYADRPFLFFIGHIPSGLILFMGRIEDAL